MGSSRGTLRLSNNIEVLQVIEFKSFNNFRCVFAHDDDDTIEWTFWIAVVDQFVAIS